MIPYDTYGIDDNLPWSTSTSRKLVVRVTAVPGTVFPNDFREVINHELVYADNRPLKSKVTKCNVEVYKYFLLNIVDSKLTSVHERDTVISAIYDIKVAESPVSAGLPKICSIWHTNKSF